MICRICNNQNLQLLEVASFMFPGQSYAPDFHIYENYICADCGVVSVQPEPSDEALEKHYNSSYRVSRNATKIGGKLVDAPFDLTVGGRSIARFSNFHSIAERNMSSLSEFPLTKNDLVIDFGAYQGLFLHALKHFWDCDVLAYDYSKSGIAFAKNYLGFKNSKVAKDIYRDSFPKKAKLATMVHSLEHLREPSRFLKHLRDTVLHKNGYLYVEVPNLYGIPLCEPTHFFTYSIESLTYLMESSGFEIIAIETGGFPVVPEFIAHNDVQNLICLARPSGQKDIVPSKPDIHLDQIRHQLRRSYRSHSAKALTRQMRTIANETARFLYYFGFAGILENISPSLATWVLRILGRRP